LSKARGKFERSLHSNAGLGAEKFYNLGGQEGEIRDMLKTYFIYWGKAEPKYKREPKWHPFVYHCLDMAAVRWKKSSSRRECFLKC
jgi:hypothetical protein